MTENAKLLTPLEVALLKRDFNLFEIIYNHVVQTGDESDEGLYSA